MKKLYQIIFFLTYLVSFSQSENDANDIIKLVVSNYKNDTIDVFYKFRNKELSDDLRKTEWDKIDLGKIFDECSKKYDTITEKNLFFECLTSKFPNDTATFQFEKIKVNHFENEKLLEKTNNKKLKKYYKTLYNKTKKSNPLAIISYPLFSVDRKKAIIYCTYIKESLAGNTGYYIIEKINEKWKINNYILTGFM